MFLKALIKFLKKNEFESKTLRRIFKEKFGISVGLYSYGCFDTSRIPQGTKIGRYCSFAPTCNIFSRNHGIKFLSLHPYLYNSSLGLISEDTISNTSCEVEDDVWIGHNATITPSVTNIGRGSVIAAGSVVTQNVPRYAIYAGIPAKLIKYRFDEETINKIESSKWWEIDKDELRKLIKNNSELIYKPEQYYEKN